MPNVCRTYYLCILDFVELGSHFSYETNLMIIYLTKNFNVYKKHLNLKNIENFHFSISKHKEIIFFKNKNIIKLTVGYSYP